MCLTHKCWNRLFTALFKFSLNKLFQFFITTEQTTLKHRNLKQQAKLIFAHNSAIGAVLSADSVPLLHALHLAGVSSFSTSWSLQYDNSKTVRLFTGRLKDSKTCVPREPGKAVWPIWDLSQKSCSLTPATFY